MLCRSVDYVGNKQKQGKVVLIYQIQTQTKERNKLYLFFNLGCVCLCVVDSLALTSVFETCLCKGHDVRFKKKKYYSLILVLSFKHL